VLLAETYIPGRELTCAVMGDRALGVIDIRPATGEQVLDAPLTPTLERSGKFSV
jgi:D-alanine-D-alanine ligase-like ATP-grasp enzyme